MTCGIFSVSKLHFSRYRYVKLKHQAMLICREYVFISRGCLLRRSHDDARDEQQQVQYRHEPQAGKGRQQSSSPAPYRKMRLKPEEGPRKHDQEQVTVCDCGSEELVDGVAAGDVRIFVYHIGLYRGCTGAG